MVELSKMIEKNIMKTNEFEDAVYYRASCTCGAHEHDVTIEIEKDSHTAMIYLNFYKKIAWCSHWGDEGSYFQRFWKRISASFKILFTGYIDLEESFILNEESIDPFIKALAEGRDYLRKKREQTIVDSKNK
jgi:hypothetical protein